jgi:hypothetical protein
VPHTHLKVPARLVYVRGPVPNGAAPNAGYSYFKARFTAAGFMAEVEAMAAQIILYLGSRPDGSVYTHTSCLSWERWWAPVVG